ncbi:G-type lectin S-receptor-like serine/threonine-protein kinase At5g35370 isoform X2 [Mangifera indica]|uniref:G-type lectin S-receptor-like serine/threonine-protein kinase At5g35370 isoform X2 n=1 Tax=Mangifera indica TaxID=29780 RepID=UPI001CFBFA0D|nr:G-type lectin S-receptor-like serine/threonine-protein kinase At5g35370 isoform X2 [Mangifera indica]
MDSLSLFVTVFFCHNVILLQLTSSAPILTNSISPNVTASSLQFIDNSGAFLLSLNKTFKLSFSRPNSELSLYYLSIFHSSSNIIIWTANPNKPFSESSKFTLSLNGLTITDDHDSIVWSTPKLNSSVSVMLLQDSGNLVLLDAQNVSLWESFSSPTDTLVSGQRLYVGQSLNGAVSGKNLSVGDYRFVVTDGDAVFQWNGLNYWKLSMYTSAFKNSNSPVSFLSVNATGLYLFASDGSTVVIQVILGFSSNFRIAKLESNGNFSVSKFVSNSWVEELAIPDDDCRIPFICKKLGLCSSSSCSCPSDFHPNINGDCVPVNSSISLPSPCTNGSELNSSSITYLRLDNGLDYFYNDFVQPVKHGIDLSECQDLCSGNCSCLAFFHEDESGFCYLIENHLGSIMSTSSDKDGDRFGFIKTRVSSSQDGNTNMNASNQKGKFPIAVATDSFKTQIGSGGFGTVYKGTLQDNTVVAVKKITSMGIQGKKEFCTEIAIIGNIHHVNLVRLKGFCVQGRQRLLVYEYMNKGSLDKTLFGNGPVLGWRERFEIALGTARGLAYLHSGCDHKIIHCDVKPENILLHENFHVKISDFGLSKLLGPEQSGIYTTMRGTRGYLAPEWLTNTAITDKTDVYSYGMVLLEIVRGRKNCSSQTERSTEKDTSDGTPRSSSFSPMDSRSVYFPLLALEMHEQRRYLELADVRLEGQVRREEVEKLVRVALLCVQEEPMLRPSMANVVSMLEGGLPLGEPNIESLRFLRFYGQRSTEPSTIRNSNEQNEFILYSEANGTNSSANTASYNFLSFMSS